MASYDDEEHKHMKLCASPLPENLIMDFPDRTYTIIDLGRKVKDRTIFYEYFDVQALPVGEIPYSVIHKALKHEKYMRLFEPTFCRNDLMRGNLAALLYWYPHYIDQLYEFAVEGKDYMMYFRGLPNEIVEAFDYLFPEVKRRLDKVKENRLNLSELEEIKIKRRKV